MAGTDHKRRAVPDMPALPPDFFEVLVEAAPDAILVVDESGRIVLANGHCEVVFGWAPGDLVGRPGEVLVPPRLRGPHAEKWQADLADRGARPVAAGSPWTAMRADGTEVSVEVALRPIETAAGLFLVASFRDATVRRQMEREIEASERRWKTSLASMLDAFAIFRSIRQQGRIVDFEFVYVNEAAAATYQRPIEELVGASLRAVLPGIESSGHLDDFRRIVETGLPLKKLDHHYADVLISGVFDTQAWKLDDGFAVTWRDVSDREASAVALQASEERFRACMEDLRDALSIFTAVRDASGEIVDFRWDDANGAASAMTGFAPRSLAGRLLLEVLPDHGPSGMLDVYKRVVETGEPYLEPSLWYEDVWGDGTRQRRAFDVRATKLQDGFVVVTREVTAVRMHQEAVARQQAELERSNREIRLLNELAEFLQGCVTSEEAHLVVARSSEMLFPECAGSLSIIQPSRDVLESSAAWGDVPPAPWPSRPSIAGPCGGAGPTCPGAGSRAVPTSATPGWTGASVSR